VRYPHPLPPPPFPPKLLGIKTDPARYSGYEFLQAMEDDKELPMVVDSELGMPLEPGRGLQGYWDGRRDGEIAAPTWPTCPADVCILWTEYASMPSQEGQMELDDEDKELLGEPQAATSSSAAGLVSNFHTTGVPNAGGAPPTPATTSRKADVTWLRRTEYLASEATLGRRQSTESIRYA
jgi:RNA polymerase II-associated factor 1